MSTRCNIKFGEGGKVYAKLYRHSDGYPDGPGGVLADMERFFRAVERDTRDTRYGDPQYLAAKFVVWQANDSRASSAAWRKEMKSFGKEEKDGPLNFLSLGVTMIDAGDGEYVYYVDCGRIRPGTGRPTVLWRKRGAKKLKVGKLDKKATAALASELLVHLSLPGDVRKTACDLPNHYPLQVEADINLITCANCITAHTKATDPDEARVQAEYEEMKSKGFTFDDLKAGASRGVRRVVAQAHGGQLDRPEGACPACGHDPSNRFRGETGPLSDLSVPGRR